MGRRRQAMARVLGLLALAVASCGAYNVAPLTESVLSGKSVNALVTDVLHGARDENPVGIFLEQRTGAYRRETSVLHQGLALLKEMRQDIEAKAAEAEKAKKKCNKKKELAYVAASRKSNSTSEALRQAHIELEQAESTVAAVQATLDKKSAIVSKKQTVVQKQIKAATAQIEITSKQLALIMEVTNVVKAMNATYHGDARHAFEDIGEVFNMLHSIAFNLRLEIKIQKKTLLTHQLQLETMSTSLTSEKMALANATRKFKVTSSKIQDRSASLTERLESAEADLQAIGIERDECVQVVNNESRTHEQSGEVIEYIIAYFRKLIGLDSSTVAVVNGTGANGTVENNTMGTVENNTILMNNSQANASEVGRVNATTVPGREPMIHGDSVDQTTSKPVVEDAVKPKTDGAGGVQATPSVKPVPVGSSGTRRAAPVEKAAQDGKPQKVQQKALEEEEEVEEGAAGTVVSSRTASVRA